MNPSIYSTKEFTGGVISPIFGYDSKEADKAREIFEVNKDKDEKEDSEDEQKQMEDKIQKLTDKYVTEIDQAINNKSDEVMTV